MCVDGNLKKKKKCKIEKKNKDIHLGNSTH